MREPVIRGGALSRTQALQLDQQLKSANLERDNALQQLKDRDQALKVTSTKARDLEKERDTILSRLTDRERILKQKDDELGALRRDNQSIKETIAKKDSTIATLNSELADLRRGSAATADLARDKSRLTDEIVMLRSELRARETVIGENLKEIERLRAAPPVAVPTDKVERALNASRAVPVGLAMTNLASQVASAQASMKSAHGFAIKGVNVTLRGNTDSEGQIRLFDAADEGIARGFDEIKFGVSPEEPTGDTQGDQVIVPNLRGMTLAAATRLLSSIGLRIDAATGKSPGNLSVSAGQAYRQTPDPDQVVDRGTNVLVVFEQPEMKKEEE